MSENPDDTREAAPGHSLWPIGFAIGIAVILVGLVISWPAMIVGAALAIVFGVLWIRDTARSHAPVDSAPAHALVGDEPSRRTGRRRGSSTSRPTAGPASSRSPRSASAASSAPASRFRRSASPCCPSFTGEGGRDERRRPRPDLELPGGDVRDHDSFTANKLQGDVSRRTAYIRNNGAHEATARTAELHDHLQPLRPPRLPGAAERAEVRGQGREVQGRDADAGAAGRLRLPLPRRRLRHGGQPHRRPARALARPLRVLDRRRSPRPRQALQRRHGRRPGRGRRRSRGTGRPIRASTSTASSAGSIPSRCRGPEWPSQPARAQIDKAVLYPLDWIEERTGLVGGVKYFLFRNVPRDVNWMQTLGAATLTAFLVQATTGVFLAMYYKPDPNSAYESIQNITNEVTLGWLVRGMHKWGASLFIILMFLHMARTFLFGAYKYPRELNWIIGVLLLVTRACSRASPATSCRGTRRPTGRRWSGININATAPIAGPVPRPVPAGRRRRSAPTRWRSSTRIHMLADPRRDHGADPASTCTSSSGSVSPRRRGRPTRPAASAATSLRRPGYGDVPPGPHPRALRERRARRWRASCSRRSAPSSSATRRTSARRGSRSSPTRSTTTRSCRSSSSPSSSASR